MVVVYAKMCKVVSDTMGLSLAGSQFTSNDAFLSHATVNMSFNSESETIYIYFVNVKYPDEEPSR